MPGAGGAFQLSFARSQGEDGAVELAVDLRQAVDVDDVARVLDDLHAVDFPPLPIQLQDHVADAGDEVEVPLEPPKVMAVADCIVPDLLGAPVARVDPVDGRLFRLRPPAAGNDPKAPVRRLR